MEKSDKTRKGHLYKIWWDKLKALYRRSDRFFHLLVGMPSYDKYVEHMRIHHPDTIPKTQKEFFAEALEAKYGAGSAKC
ncbi:KCU-star family selenoprotein [Helicobacter sp. MIT 21-1697]|uniref:KCU-star family selenoprotein n=1 Tax=Helicobacter sp. MIT 21-1697 TaxID=2993733 RepID=UPI00224A4B74|nr:KCU-star family selenoprotein [Helicobacter sp. MIT 21-1697]MCX2716578.1 KCU-star family selenoprotein [Helicobacter sp. MIT 21-1697]